MPLMRCTKGSILGWKWGNTGTCYIGRNAKQKAIAQALAIGGGEFPEDRKDTNENNIFFFKQYLKQEILKKRNKKIRIKKSSRWLYPIGVEREYNKFIKSIMNQFINITIKEMKPLLRDWRKSNLELLEDDAVDDMEGINKQYKEVQDNIFIDNINDLKIELAIIAASVSEFNQKQFLKTMKQALGFTYTAYEAWEDPLVKIWIADNINLIRGLTDDYIKQINHAVISGFAEGQTAEALAKELTKINKRFADGRREVLTRKGVPVLTKAGNQKYRRVQSRASLIARDQIGKLNGQYTRKRQTDVGVETYFWRTALDERVRKTHLAMEGELCMWDEASVYSEDGGKSWISRSAIGGIQLHPGQDVQCRCGAESNWDSVVNEVELELAA